MGFIESFCIRRRWVEGDGRRGVVGDSDLRVVVDGGSVFSCFFIVRFVMLLILLMFVFMGKSGLGEGR